MGLEEEVGEGEGGGEEATGRVGGMEGAEATEEGEEEASEGGRRPLHAPAFLFCSAFPLSLSLLCVFEGVVSHWNVHSGVRTRAMTRFCPCTLILHSGDGLLSTRKHPPPLIFYSLCPTLLLTLATTPTRPRTTRLTGPTSVPTAST